MIQAFLWKRWPRNFGGTHDLPDYHRDTLVTIFD